MSIDESPDRSVVERFDFVEQVEEVLANEFAVLCLTVDQLVQRLRDCLSNRLGQLVEIELAHRFHLLVRSRLFRLDGIASAFEFRVIPRTSARESLAHFLRRKFRLTCLVLSPFRFGDVGRRGCLALLRRDGCWLEETVLECKLHSSQREEDARQVEGRAEGTEGAALEELLASRLRALTTVGQSRVSFISGVPAAEELAREGFKEAVAVDRGVEEDIDGLRGG